MKGKTQLPQLPDDGDEDADGDGDVVVGGDVHSEYFVIVNNVMLDVIMAEFYYLYSQTAPLCEPYAV